MIRTSRTKWNIWEETQIKLSGLARAPLLWDVFDRYQLGWMTRLYSSHSQALVHEFFISYEVIV